MSDPLIAYVRWFLQQPEAFRFHARAEPTRSAVVIPFRPRKLSRVS
jgi:phage terminase large subunit-like protein